MIEPTQPANSIDSELEEILDWVAKMHTEKPRGWNDEMVTNIALKAIATKYVSRKEVEEVIGEDDVHADGNTAYEAGKDWRNQLRQIQRTKLEQLFNEKEK